MTKPSQKPKDPFGNKKQTPPQKSEEDTPVTGTYVPKGVVTPKAPTPPLPESAPLPAVTGLAAELAEIGTLRSNLVQTRRDLEQAQATVQDQSGQIATLREALALAHSSHEVTEEDIQKLHAMFAQIQFERSRDGNQFYISLRGQRSRTSGKAKNFAQFADLLAFLRAG